MKKRITNLPLLLAATLLSSTIARGQAWTWQGDYSNKWGDMENWTNGVAGQQPVLDDFNNTTPPLTVRIGMGAFMPENQNIDDLALTTLQIGPLTTNLTVYGNAIKIHNNIDHLSQVDTTPVIVFSNAFAFAGGSPNVTLRRPTHFYGALTQFDGVRRFVGNAGGELHFHGAVDFTGGFANNGSIYFYGDETTGGAPAAYVPDYFNAKIGGRPATAVIGADAWFKETFIPTVQQRGAAIAIQQVKLLFFFQ
jgi:hypothetical protein